MRQLIGVDTPRAAGVTMNDRHRVRGKSRLAAVRNTSVDGSDRCTIGSPPQDAELVAEHHHSNSSKSRGRQRSMTIWRMRRGTR